MSIIPFRSGQLDNGKPQLPVLARILGYSNSTVPELAALLEPAQVHAKRHFSCAGEPPIVAALEAHARRRS